MFSMLKVWLYVQVFEDRVRARNIETGQTTEIRPRANYTHSRALVGSFSEAGVAVKAAVEAVKGTSLFKSVRILIQPMAKCEGGLSPVEKRVLFELAIQAGASRAIVWDGDILSDDAVRTKIEGR